MPDPISFPKGFRRLDNFALDADSAFDSLSSFLTYAAGASSYAGQLCSVTENGITTIYRIESNKSVTPMSSQGDAVALAVALG